MAAPSAAAASAAELTLLVDGYLAGSIIGKGGSTLRSIKSSSGVLTLQLSQESSAATRTVSLTGRADAVHEAYRLIAQVLRAEAERVRRPSDAVRLLVPSGLGAQLLAKQAAGVKQLRRSSGASVELEAHAATPKRKLLRCTGTEAQTAAAVRYVVELAAEREGGRHADFLRQWPFETSYNDHFETPQVRRPVPCPPFPPPRTACSLPTLPPPRTAYGPTHLRTYAPALLLTYSPTHVVPNARIA